MTQVVKNPVSSETRTYLFYIVNIMGADVLMTQGARASATMIFTMLNWINSVPTSQLASHGIIGQWSVDSPHTWPVMQQVFPCHDIIMEFWILREIPLNIQYHPGTHCGLVMPYGDRFGSTLAQVMACCLTAPSHYLKQCWLIINKVSSWRHHQMETFSVLLALCAGNRASQTPYAASGIRLRPSWAFI